MSSTPESEGAGPAPEPAVPVAPPAAPAPDPRANPAGIQPTAPPPETIQEEAPREQSAAHAARSGGSNTVVVVGAGFAGLAVAKKLKKMNVRTVVIDRNNYNVFSPLLYQVGTALLDSSEIAHPIRQILRPVKNSEFLLGSVQRVDFDQQQVITDRGPVNYDYLVLAAGSQTNFFGNQSIQDRSVGMKTLEDALALRNEVIRRFEDARWVRSDVERRNLLTFIVVGGGSTGVETAGALKELVSHALRKDFKEMNISDVEVILLEASPQLLGPFKPKLQERARLRLEKKGIRVLLNTAVTEVRDDAVVLSTGESLAAGLVVWTAGVRACDLAATLGVQTGRANAVKVGPTLQVLGRPEVFVIGDMAAIDHEGKQLPMLAPVATQGGKLAAKNIASMIQGKPLENFEYRDKGIMSTIGRNSAVVQFRKFSTEGFFGWLSWLFVHLILIVSFRSQLNIIVNWFWNYILNDRPARLIVEGSAIDKAEASNR